MGFFKVLKYILYIIKNKKPIIYFYFLLLNNITILNYLLLKKWTLSNLLTVKSIQRNYFKNILKTITFSYFSYNKSFFSLKFQFYFLRNSYAYFLNVVLCLIHTRALNNFFVHVHQHMAYCI